MSLNRNTDIYKPAFDCIDIEGWMEGLSNNIDPYGRACFIYAEDWACLMEAKIKEGIPLDDCAKNTSHEADTDGITGFMYGNAVSILSNCWRHGEKLRIWHNIETQIKDEGEKANEKGTVLNPAIVEIC